MIAKRPRGHHLYCILQFSATVKLLIKRILLIYVLLSYDLMSRSTKSLHSSNLFSFSLHYLLPGHPSLLKSYLFNFTLQRDTEILLVIMAGPFQSGDSFIHLPFNTCRTKQIHQTTLVVGFSSISLHAAKRGFECITGKVMSFLDATRASRNIVLYVS